MCESEININLPLAVVNTMNVMSVFVMTQIGSVSQNKDISGVIESDTWYIKNADIAPSQLAFEALEK